ncbi:MAG: ATP-dependent Clp protease proteolytic subunit [Armatimonadota bacterium]
MAREDEWKPEDRFLFLTGEITDEQTEEIVRRILQHWDREFLLVISSDGGSSFNALSLVNLMREHGRIDTLCTGVALSGAADCLAAGRRRYIVRGAIAMLHQVSWEMGREFAANFLQNARFLERLNAQLADGLCARTGRSREELDRDLSTDYYLFGDEILQYGLADAYWDPAELLPRKGRDERRKGRLRPEPRELSFVPRPAEPED